MQTKAFEFFIFHPLPNYVLLCIGQSDKIIDFCKNVFCNMTKHEEDQAVCILLQRKCTWRQVMILEAFNEFSYASDVMFALNCYRLHYTAEWLDRESKWCLENKKRPKYIANPVCEFHCWNLCWKKMTVKVGI